MSHLTRGLAGLLLAHALPAATWLPPVRRLTPRLAGRGEARHVALTLDDGPDALSTPLFLDELARLGCHATFFVLGMMLQRNPSLGRRIVGDGHEIAVHGWHHGNPLVTRPGRVSAEMRRTVRLIEDVCGVSPSWYRPPYGVLSAEALFAARRDGLRPVLWTAWGKDWTASATPGSVLVALSRGLGGGATLLLHDSDSTSAPHAWRAALGALPGVVATCRADGLTVGPLRDHGVHSARTSPGHP
ncbi:polysaccharide deacetylase family protein [Actinomadura sp. WMMA1423]|uniref:polysaccharide deacetylase family protein n=1 Tax=Actinomadura sp. WMMA1423 TaxID=2591108 RepID=UPI00114700B4|nr:polysaccharide deacetylase family protein [Actinomadura sp. WMMA1423]